MLPRPIFHVDSEYEVRILIFYLLNGNLRLILLTWVSMEPFTLTLQSLNSDYNFHKISPFSYPFYRNTLTDDKNNSVRPIFHISKTGEFIKGCPAQIWHTGDTSLLREYIDTKVAQQLTKLYSNWMCVSPKPPLLTIINQHYMLFDCFDSENSHPAKYLPLAGDLVCGCAAQPLFLFGGG